MTIGGLACGLGVLLLVSLEPTRTNLCFACFYITVGLSVATPVPPVDRVDRMDPGWAARLQGQFEVATIVIAVFYLGSLLATSQASPRAARVVTWATRAGAALAVWHSLTTLLFPAQRLDDFQLSTLAGTPLLISLTFLPPSIGTVSCAAGMLVVLLGQFRYLKAQGLRGAFISRFLSAQVTELVRLKGLAHVMQPKDVEITVVARGRHHSG